MNRIILAAMFLGSATVAQAQYRPSQDQTFANEETETYTVMSEKTGQPVQVRVRRHYPRQEPQVYVVPVPVPYYYYGGYGRR